MKDLIRKILREEFLTEMPTKKTQDEFIKRSKEIHDNKYDYSKVIYINNRTPVTIICPLHGEFQQKPKSHLLGRGCQICGGTTQSNSESFITKAKQIHRDKYTYDKVNYKNAITPVTITCPIHGDFLQKPHYHLLGRGCNQCGLDVSAKKRAKTTEDFIERAKAIHGNKYSYEKVNYINSKTPVEIICPKHGSFFQDPANHLQGNNCTICGYEDSIKTRTKSTEEFITQANLVNNNKYTYEKTNYKTAHTPVIITCSKHGDFTQKPNEHLRGVGCPLCSESKGEKLISTILKNNNIEYVKQKTFTDCVGLTKRCIKLPFDFYLPKYNTLIEYDGQQHFKPVSAWGGEEGFLKIKQRDKIKNDYSISKNIKLIRVPYTMKKQDIESYIKKELGIIS